MGKAFGILLVVVGLWAAAEIYTNGSANAFGGILVRTGLVDEQSAEAQPITLRAGSKVTGAHAESDARRNRMLKE